MKITIGENIKRLRHNMDLTQEQLAECLSVSNVAVSKWERGETYPDITMLPSIAKFFAISLDDLMGYDVAHENEETQRIESDYWQLRAQGRIEEATKLILSAWQEHSDNYGIMALYMHDIIGGKVAKTEKLLAHKEELTQICNRILNGCRIEKYRLEAINIKAKILHATGRTGEALALLDEFPKFGNTAGMRSEQLFEYDTEESRSWVRKNLYSIADGFAIKLVKKIWFGDNLQHAEKVAYGEKLGDGFSKLYTDSGETSILIIEHKFWESLSLRMIMYRQRQEDIIRIKEKELRTAAKMDQVAKTDTVLKAMIQETYKGKSVLEWTVAFMETAPQNAFEKMRNNQEYVALLNRYI